MAAFSRWALVLMIALIAVFSALLVADPARAQTVPCGPVDQVLTELSDQYGEQLIGQGEGPNGTQMLLFSHPEGDTWTVVGILPGGQACFIASGSHWDIHEFTPAGSET